MNRGFLRNIIINGSLKDIERPCFDKFAGFKRPFEVNRSSVVNLGSIKI